MKATQGTFIHFFYLTRGYEQMTEGFKLTYLDLILILVVIAFIYKGYKKRFFTEFVSFIGFIIALSFGLAAIPFFAPNLYNMSKLQFGASISVAFLIAFVFVWVAYRFFERWLYKHAKFEMTEKIDRFLGLTIGTMKGILVASLIAIFVSIVTISDVITRQVESSNFILVAERAGPTLYNKLRKFIPGSEDFVVYFERLIDNVNPNSVDDKTIALLKALNSKKVEQWSDSKAEK